MRRSLYVGDTFSELTPTADGPQSRSRDGGSGEGEGVNVPDSEAVRPLGKMSGHANRTPRQHGECSGADQERGS